MALVVVEELVDLAARAAIAVRAAVPDRVLEPAHALSRPSPPHQSVEVIGLAPEQLIEAPLGLGVAVVDFERGGKDVEDLGRVGIVLLDAGPEELLHFGQVALVDP